MNLQDALEVVTRSLSAEDARRWPTAEGIYLRHGSPTRKQPDQLAAVMKEIIQRCYIPIIYKRLKQWERKEWPAIAIEAAPVKPRSEADLIAEARAVYPPDVFERWLQAHRFGDQVPQPQKTVVEFKQRRAHG